MGAAEIGADAAPQGPVGDAGDGVDVDAGPAADAGPTACDRGTSTRSVAQLDDDALVVDPSVVVDAEGNATVVWSGGGGQVDARRYEPGSGWSDVTVLDSGLSFDAHVAGNAAGDVFVSWTVWTGEETWIRVRRYDPDVGWELPFDVSPHERENDGGGIAVDGAGNAVVTWRNRVDGATHHAWSNRYRVGEGWGVPARADDGLSSDGPVAANEEGAFVATWTRWMPEIEERPPRVSAWSTRDPIAPWSAKASAVPGTGGSVDRVGLDEAGNAFVLWFTPGGPGSVDLWAATQSAAAPDGWSDPFRLAAASPAQEVALSVAPSGEAFAVWLEAYNLWAARHVAGDGWEKAKRIDEAAHGLLVGGDGVLDVATDARGEAVAVWSQPDEDLEEHVWAARYRCGVWQDAFVIAPDRGGTSPEVAMSPDGTAVVVWHGQGIWAAVLP